MNKVERDMLFYERGYQKKGYKFVCGIDEAGRGPLAGPVCAAAVVLDENTVIDDVDDSKKLSPKKRELLYDIIIRESAAYSIAYADREEIDRINILNATYLAMKRAVEGLSIRPDILLVDGNGVPEIDIECLAIVKGDSLSESIACASILAKVSRDRLMIKLAEKYPEYGFERHKGYGTKLHIEMIKKHGITDLHRKSFLGKLLGNEKQ